MISIPRTPRRRGTFFLAGILFVAVCLTMNLFGDDYSATAKFKMPTSLPLPSSFHYKARAASEHVNQHALIPSSRLKKSAPGFEDALASCRVYDLPNDPLVKEYGQNNIRLSRTYEGSGHRVRKMLQKALRGEAIKIAVVGGSVSSGHGVLPPFTSENYMYERVFAWFKETFPGDMHELSTDGAIPATTAFYFSFCVHEHIPHDVDLVIMELDINSYDPTQVSLAATEALYRTILDLPQQPAIIYASVFALIFPDMTHGWRHSALISQWMDVPEINVRNFLIPHLMKHPDEVPTWYLNWHDLLDPRHFNKYGHRAIADMIIAYLREQLCFLQREGPYELESMSSLSIPSNEIAGAVPRIAMLGGWDEHKALPVQVPYCKAINSARKPLQPVSANGWEAVVRNDKRSFETTVPGSEITFSFPVQDGLVGFFYWRTKDEAFGAVTCWIDNDTRPERIRRIVGHDPNWGASIFEHANELWMDLTPGDHTITCRAEPGPAGGTTFRISAVVSR